MAMKDKASRDNSDDGNGDDNDGVIPVLVIGAGPHALTLVTKFLEAGVDPFEESPWNSKLFMQRPGGISYRYPKAKRQLASEKDSVIKKKVRTASKTKFEARKIFRVFDTHGDWLRQWQYQFDKLGIEYLRSSVNGHVDPVSWETLEMDILAKPMKNRSCPPQREMHHLQRGGCYHGPFAVPSSEHFVHFTDKIVQRYNLESLVEEGTAVSVVPDPNEDGVYIVEMDNGQTVRAEHVVLALGPQRTPRWPDAMLPYNNNKNGNLSASGTDAGDSETITTTTTTNQPRYPCVHSVGLLCPNARNEWTRLLSVLAASSSPRVLVVGGGLTSAHLVVALHNHCEAMKHNNNNINKDGESDSDGDSDENYYETDYETDDCGRGDLHVTLVSRSELKVQAFDLQLSWMGLTRGHLLAQFWSEEDFENRVRLIRDAKNKGASISPEVFEKLKELEEESKLTILEETEMMQVDFLGDEGDSEQPSWCVDFDPPLEDGEPGEYDYVICATGTTTNLSHEPLLSHFYPEIDVLESTQQAILDPDLRVARDHNVFVLGEAAALQLGPGAVNLMGGRAGAARVVRAIRNSMDGGGGDHHDKQPCPLEH